MVRTIISSPTAVAVLDGALIFFGRTTSAVVAVVSAVIRGISSPAAVVTAPSTVTMLIDALVRFFGRSDCFNRATSTIVAIVVRAVIMAVSSVITSPPMFINGQVGRVIGRLSFFGRVGQSKKASKSNLFEKRKIYSINLM